MEKRNAKFRRSGTLTKWVLLVKKEKKMFFRFCRPILDIFGFPLLISEINAAKVVGKKVCPLIHLSFVYCLSCSFDAKIFLQIVGQRRASPWNDKSCLNKPICNSQFTAGKKNKHVICRLKVGLYSEKL